MTELSDKVARAAGAQVATQQPQDGDDRIGMVGTFLKRMAPEMARALPKGLDADRLARIALTEVRKTPQLLECTQESFAGALMNCAQLGLEPGVFGEVYLIPRRNKRNGNKLEVQLQMGYQGLAKLFWQSPLARHLDAQAVYERDEFDYAYGTAHFLRHKPATCDRGPVVAYYAVCELSTGASHFVVLSPEEVKELRGGLVGTSGGIADPQHWMERKTALKQLFKITPRSTLLLSLAVSHDDTVRVDYRHDLESITPVHANELGAGEVPPPAGVEPLTGELIGPDDDEGPDARDIAEVLRREAAEGAEWKPDGDA